MWVLDYLDEIESDLSVFHRVDDPMQISSSRYYRLAERLVHYDGALRHVLATEREGQPAVAVQQEGPPLPEGAVVVDLDTAVLMANDDPSFPGIEYVRG